MDVRRQGRQGVEHLLHCHAELPVTYGDDQKVRLRKADVGTDRRWRCFVEAPVVHVAQDFRVATETLSHQRGDPLVDRHHLGGEADAGPFEQALDRHHPRFPVCRQVRLVFHLRVEVVGVVDHLRTVPDAQQDDGRKLVEGVQVI